jgi:transcriptional regulator with XRE-family HTH domain
MCLRLTPDLEAYTLGIVKTFTKSGGLRETSRSRFYFEVGRKIRQERRRQGITQLELASSVSLARASIANIEIGRQGLLLHVLRDIAIALHVDLASLIPAESADSQKRVEQVIHNYRGPGKEWLKRVVSRERTEQ